MKPPVLYASFDVVPSAKGASTHILAFARGLARSYDVDLFTLGRKGLPELEERDGIRIHRVMADEGNLLDRVEHFRRDLIEHVARRSYRLAHFRSIWSGFPLLRVKKEKGLRLVYEANGFPSMELPNHYPGLAKEESLLRKMAMQERACMEGSDCIVTPSAVTAEFMVRRGADPERIAVIPNGVRLELFPSTPLPRGEVTTLAYLGTLAPWQGFGVLLPALKKVLRLHPVRLLVLGSGKKRWLRHYQELARQCRVHRHVEFRMRVPHERVGAELGEASIGVAPLTRDPRNVVQGCCPIKILEYMACGRPVVASDLPVVRELMDHERHGVLVKAESVNDLADGLLRLIEEREAGEAMGRRARAHAETMTWDRALEGLHACYDKVLA